MKRRLTLSEFTSYITESINEVMDDLESFGLEMPSEEDMAYYYDGQAEDESESMYDDFGNHSINANRAIEDLDIPNPSKSGALAMAALGDDEYDRNVARNPELWSSKKSGSYGRSDIEDIDESKLDRIINEAIRKVLKR